MSNRDLVGSVDLSIAVFWRDSERMQLGVRYSIDCGLAPTTSRDLDQRVSAFGTFYLGRFDVGGSVAYTRSDVTTSGLSFGGGTFPSFDSYANGVRISADTTWYAMDRLSVGLDAAYSHSAYASDFGRLSTKGDFGSVTLGARALPPCAKNRWVVVGAWLGYGRSRSRLDGEPPSGLTFDDSSRKSYTVGASLQIV